MLFALTVEVVAMPLLFVTSVIVFEPPAKVALCPLAGAVNVTVSFCRGLLLASFTMAASGFAKGASAGVVWLPPLEMAMLAAGTGLSEKAKRTSAVPPKEGFAFQVLVTDPGVARDGCEDAPVPIPLKDGPIHKREFASGAAADCGEAGYHCPFPELNPRMFATTAFAFTVLKLHETVVTEVAVPWHPAASTGLDCSTELQHTDIPAI